MSAVIALNGERQLCISLRLKLFSLHVNYTQHLLFISDSFSGLFEISQHRSQIRLKKKMFTHLEALSRTLPGEATMGKVRDDCWVVVLRRDGMINMWPKTEAIRPLLQMRTSGQVIQLRMTQAKTHVHSCSRDSEALCAVCTLRAVYLRCVPELTT